MAKESRLEALRQSDRLFRLLVQGLTDHAIFMLNSDGHIRNWNSGAQHIKGYTAEEIIGQHFSRFYTAEDLETDEPRRALETALRTGRYEKEGWRVRKDRIPVLGECRHGADPRRRRRPHRVRQGHP